MKKVLLINDMAGYGKVALSAMIPILSHMELELFNLPTALVSNTLDYGKFDILETTDYMRNTLTVWDELGFSYDAIATGFIVSEEQVQLILDYCEKQHSNGVRIFTDPIMGDDGRLYNGVTEKTVGYMRRLISVSDVIMPNYTEASYLSGISYSGDSLPEAGIKEIIDKLLSLGTKSVVVTSAFVEGQKQVCGYDGYRGEYFFLPFHEIPVRFPGTGDIFSSVIIGRMLHNWSLESATRSAMRVVEGMIQLNIENVDRYKGIPIETCLKVLEE